MTEASPLHFRKMNGLGNDFVVFDARRRPIAMDEARARAIADRATGIGCDQLIVLEPSSKADVTMRIWNNEGGEVESCGNATRCIADILFDEKKAARATIDTKGGFLVAEKGGDRLVTQHTRQLPQDTQMLIRLGGDTDHHMSLLPFGPLHTLAEVQHLNPGLLHQIPGIRGAVGNGDATAQVGGALSFAL